MIRSDQDVTFGFGVSDISLTRGNSRFVDRFESVQVALVLAADFSSLKLMSKISTCLEFLKIFATKFIDVH